LYAQQAQEAQAKQGAMVATSPAGDQQAMQMQLIMTAFAAALLGAAAGRAFS
jgi:hypothetical protein